MSAVRAAWCASRIRQRPGTRGRRGSAHGEGHMDRRACQCARFDADSDGTAARPPAVFLKCTASGTTWPERGTRGTSDGGDQRDAAKRREPAPCSRPVPNAATGMWGANSRREQRARPSRSHSARGNPPRARSNGKPTWCEWDGPQECHCSRASTRGAADTSPVGSLWFPTCHLPLLTVCPYLP